jgi:ribosomal-protein-alanine acetyltransferase
VSADAALGATRPHVALRRAAEGDLEAIMSLETSIFVTDAWSPALMRAELSAAHSYYLVAEDHGEIVAYAGLRAVAGATDADIQTIAVAPAARRLGLGRALMVAMIGEATRRGARQVFLEVRDDNPNAQRLYDSLGFHPIAVRQHYYQPDDVDAIVMRLDLAEVPR